MSRDVEDLMRERDELRADRAALLRAAKRVADDPLCSNYVENVRALAAEVTRLEAGRG